MRILVWLLLLGGATAMADVPQTLPVQGRLNTAAGLTAPDGKYVVVFSFWTAQTNGEKLWEETHSGDNAIVVKHGVFSAALGALNPIDVPKTLNSKSVWLQTIVGTDPALPRVRVNPTPHALRSYGLNCSSCVSPQHMDMTALQSALLNSDFVQSNTLHKLAFSGSWTDLKNVPADQNTQLQEEQVDQMVANNGYASTQTLDQLKDQLTTLQTQLNTAKNTLNELKEAQTSTASGTDQNTGEIMALKGTINDLQDKLSGLKNNLDATIANLSSVAKSGSYNDLLDKPKDNTLSSQEVLSIVSNGGYVPGEHTKDTTLTEEQVDAFVANNNNHVPQGAIMMWSGSHDKIPKGWRLCDGTMGTPNLLDKFIKGVKNSTTEPGETGGGTTVDLVIPRTRVTWDIGQSSYIGGGSNNPHGNTVYAGTQTRGSTKYFSADSHANGFSIHAGKGGNKNSYGHHTAKATLKTDEVSLSGVSAQPPYYALSYIMKM